MKLYVGHGNTFHDPALAMVAGDDIFAEGIERHVQCKRALTALGVWYSEREIRTFLRDHGIDGTRSSEVVVATSWNSQRLRTLVEAVLRHPQAPTPAGALAQLQLLGLESLIFVNPFLCTLAGIPPWLLVPGPADLGRKLEIVETEHHLCHAANAVYTSPFEECVVMILDGGSDSAPTNFYHFENNQFRLLSRADATDASFGMLYAMVTGLCGFRSLNGEEWKVMGLAAYGKPNDAIYDFFKQRARVDGVNVVWRSQEVVAGMEELAKLTGGFRRPDDPDVLKSADLAHNFQRAFTDIVCELVNNASELGLSRNLAFGGGCALNSSTNGQLLARSSFEALHVPSAPADDGNALGAALYQKHAVDQEPRRLEVMSPFLGSKIDSAAVEKVCRFGKFRWEKLDDEALCKQVARLLADGALVGWVQGRAEFGPRALGNRSILADPRSASMKDQINARVKFREQYRPLAPAILHEFGHEYFEDYAESPYMERTLRFKAAVRERVPAVVHEDGTGRLQTVKEELNPLFYRLVRAFFELTGIPILLNTSFNVMGKPIIHRVEDAMAVFSTTGLDHVAIGPYLISPSAA